MINNTDSELLGIALLLGFSVAAGGIISRLPRFFQKLKMLNTEIKRSYGYERKIWRRRKLQLLTFGLLGGRIRKEDRKR